MKDPLEHAIWWEVMETCERAGHATTWARGGYAIVPCLCESCKEMIGRLVKLAREYGATDTVVE